MRKLIYAGLITLIVGTIASYRYYAETIRKRDVAATVLSLEATLNNIGTDMQKFSRQFESIL